MIAKQTAILFAEWIEGNHWWRDYWDEWCSHKYRKKVKTTEELFKLFLRRKKVKKG